MNNLTSYEKETEILYNQEEDTAVVSTYHRALINQLSKLVGKDEDIEELRHDGEYAEYLIPKSWVRISPPRKRTYTDEQKAAMAERLAAARQKRHDDNT